MKAKKKPVVVDCFKFTLKKNDKEPDWFLKEVGNKVIVKQENMKQQWYIITLEGAMKISKGDYVIKGVQGEFYPCKPDIFEQTYEIVGE